MGIVCVQSQTVGAAAKLGALQAHLGAPGVDSASVSGKLPKLTGSVGLAQHDATVVTSSLGMLRASLHVDSVNHNTVMVVTSLGALWAAGAGSAASSLHGASRLPLSAALQVYSANLNHVAVVTSLGALRGQLGAAAAGSAHAAGHMAIAARGNTAAQQSVHGRSSLTLASSIRTSAVQPAARITATLGALSARITIQPPPAGYAADGGYYVAIAARPFYATLTARPFYGAMWPRSFYILTHPDMTPTFDILDPRETMVLTLDASADLASGESLTAITEITALQQFGTTGALPKLTGEVINAQPVTLTVAGKPVTIAAGCGVQVIVTGGMTGGRYLIAATCATTNPEKVLTLKGVLPVSTN